MSNAVLFDFPVMFLLSLIKNQKYKTNYALVVKEQQVEFFSHLLYKQAHSSALSVLSS